MNNTKFKKYVFDTMDAINTMDVIGTITTTYCIILVSIL